MLKYHEYRDYELLVGLRNTILWRGKIHKVLKLRDLWN